jgi:hypothetical protein
MQNPQLSAGKFKPFEGDTGLVPGVDSQGAAASRRLGTARRGEVPHQRAIQPPSTGMMAPFT